ncbi:MAG: type II toxin-antitoxin system death-on-curing family toxin [Verrucomicrobiota bacterium]
MTLEEALYLHDESLARFGGIAGIGDAGLVESALGSAQNEFWYGQGDLFQIAAAYAFHIAESQAFNDGNKRTGAASAIMFLVRNGVHFPKDDGTVYSALIDITNKQLDKPGLAEVFRKLVEKNS